MVFLPVCVCIHTCAHTDPCLPAQFVQTIQKTVNQNLSTRKIGKRRKAVIVKHMQIDLVMWVCRKFVEEGEGMRSVHFLGGKLVI